MLASCRTLLFACLLSSTVAPAQPLESQADVASRARMSKHVAISGGISRLQAMTIRQGAARPSAFEERPKSVAVDQPSDQPDVFGSVAIHVSRTPLDKEWRRINSAPASGPWASGPWGSLIEDIRGRDHMDQLDRVNRWVNSRIRFSEDAQTYRVVDRWAPLSESVRRERGDCEDYAIAKLQLLRAAGFPAGDIYLTLVKDLVRGSDHALLIVRLDGRFLVLDNGTDKIVETHAAGDYRPIFTYSSAGAWVHGYRRHVQLASLTGAPRVTSVP